MQQLSEAEEKSLARYERISVALEGFRLLESSGLASNKLLSVLEASFAGKELAPDDFVFLRLLAERKARNYRRLTGVRPAIELFSLMLQVTFAQTGLGADA